MNNPNQNSIFRRAYWLQVYATASLLILQQALGQSVLDQKITDLSNQIAKEMAESQKTTIAVVEFADVEGNVNNLGRFFAEKLVTKLYLTKRFKVIERQLLNKVIKEQKLSLSGLVDPTSAKQLGKLLGVQAIVSGTITALEQNLDVNARLISTQTGEVFAAAATDLPIDGSIRVLMGGTQASAVTSDSIPVVNPAHFTSEDKDYKFEIASCKMSGKDVVVSFFATNFGKDRQLFIGGAGQTFYGWWGTNSRIIDYDGNEYGSKEIQLGNKVGPRVQTLVVKGIRTKGAIRFGPIQSHVQKLALLEIDCYSDEEYKGERFIIQFRNVPVKR